MQTMVGGQKECRAGDLIHYSISNNYFRPVL